MTRTDPPATPADPQTAHEHLSPRQCEIVRCIAEDYSTDEIAEKLGISHDTVATHRKQIMEKLKLHTIVALTRYAIQEGLTPLKTLDDLDNPSRE